LIQYQRVTDGQTDGRTDVQPISITCFSIADARNKTVRLHVLPSAVLEIENVNVSVCQITEVVRSMVWTWTSR